MSTQHPDRPDDAPTGPPRVTDAPPHEVDADVAAATPDARVDDTLVDAGADDEDAADVTVGAEPDVPPTPEDAPVVGLSDEDEEALAAPVSEAPADDLALDADLPDAPPPPVPDTAPVEAEAGPAADVDGPGDGVLLGDVLPGDVPPDDVPPDDVLLGDVPPVDVPPDVVHVDDDALVRPLDAPLAHVLGEDADDLSVLAAPGDAPDVDPHAAVPDLDITAAAPDRHPTADPAATAEDGGRGLDERPHDAVPVDDDAATGRGDATASVPPEVAAVGAAASAPSPAGPSPATPRTGWSVLGHALQPRVNRAQVLAGVLCALLGFALAVQIRQTSDLSLSGMRQADLVRILDEATTRGDALERERADLVDERDELLSGSDTRQAALDALRRSAETQGILAGRLPAEGRGVVVSVSDGGAQVKPVTMLNMLEELRNAGAEAMQLNDLRITASSAFTGTAGAIQLDGTTLAPPYVWKVIGDPDTIATALQMPGGAFAEVRNNGGNAAVEQQDLVEVDAIRVMPDPVHATPVPPAAG